MKKIVLVLLISFLVNFLSLSQCPPANAVKYKNEAKAMGPEEFGKQQAYIYLATYYHYKCQCENGVDDPVRQVEMVNRVVDTYAAYTRNAYGTINKVLTCKSKNGGSAIATTDSGNPNASNHGSGIHLQQGNVSKKLRFNSTMAEDLARGILGNNSEVTQALEGYNAGTRIGEMLKSPETASQGLQELSDRILGADSQVSEMIEGYRLGEQLGSSIENNDVAGMLSSGLQIFQNISAKNKQRQAYLAEQRAEQERLEEIKRQNRAIEQQKRAFFNKEAEAYRMRVQKIISARRKFFTENKDITTYDLQSNTLEPIYAYYGYSRKGYDSYKENIHYPSKMKIDIRENAAVLFSSVYGIYPHSNGTFPYWDEIKSKILNTHFPYSKEDYEIVFFDVEENASELIAGFKSNLVRAVKVNYFAKSIPPNTFDIIWLNESVNKTETSDYWKDENQVGNEIASTDSFIGNLQEVLTPRKLDYWESNPAQQDNMRVDSLVHEEIQGTLLPNPTPIETTAVQKDSVKTKKINYWNN